MKRTKKEDRAHHIRAWRGSGLSKTEYCRQNGLQLSTFYRWSREQLEEGQSTDGFIEIAIDRFQQEEHERGSAFPSVGIAIVLSNGYRLDIGKGFDSDTVGELLDLLEAR